MPLPHSLSYPTCNCIMLMVTVMGPWVARYWAIPEGRRCHQARSSLCALLSAYGRLCVFSPLPLHPSISICSLVCLPLSFPVCRPSRISPGSPPCSLSGSMMKSWIQATFLYFLALHLWVLLFPRNG